MGNKTEYSYNEDDFIEVDGQMKELTVTITLCEYRNLIQENAQCFRTIDSLNEEIGNLKKQVEATRKALLSNVPEMSEKNC